jgi:hypothetical protein
MYIFLAQHPEQSKDHPSIYPIVEGLKQLGREADHSPLSSVYFKNGGSIPPHVFMAECLVKHRNNFIS